MDLINCVHLPSVSTLDCGSVWGEDGEQTTSAGTADTVSVKVDENTLITTTDLRNNGASILTKLFFKHTETAIATSLGGGGGGFMHYTVL